MKKRLPWWAIVLIVGIVLFGLIQLVPYGHNHTNPKVINSPIWDSPATADLVKRGCYDCHSNETTWPWYSNVAPASWLVQRDVEEGRRSLNFSEWPTSTLGQQGLMDAAVRIIQEGEMPPIQFTLIHPEARFTSAELDQITKGMLNSVPK